MFHALPILRLTDAQPVWPNRRVMSPPFPVVQGITLIDLSLPWSYLEVLVSSKYISEKMLVIGESVVEAPQDHPVGVSDPTVIQLSLKCGVDGRQYLIASDWTL